jgi:hypothetical protein
MNAINELMNPKKEDRMVIEYIEGEFPYVVKSEHGMVKYSKIEGALKYISKNMKRS